MAKNKNLVTASPVYNIPIKGFPLYSIHNAYPPTLRCTLPYCEVFGANSNTVANTTGTGVHFVPNSLYAPLSGGHQPYYFDQLCSASGPYTKYKVIGFKCRITVVNSTANAVPLHFVTKLTNTTDSYSISNKLLEDVLEKPGARMDVVPSSGTQSTVVNIDVPDLSVLFNWSREQYTADTIQTVGSYGTNPTSLVGLNLAVSNAWSTSALAVNCTVEIWFDTVFTERQSVPAS